MKLVERYLLKMTRDIAKRLAKKQKTRFKSFKKLLPNDSMHDLGKGLVTHGYCTTDKDIRISFKVKHARYKYHPLSEILDTVAHEVAHLIDITHGKVWKKQYGKNKKTLKKLYL